MEQPYANTLSGVQIDNIIVCGQMNGTSTQHKSTGKGSPMIIDKRHPKGSIQVDSTKETSEQLTLLPYQNTTSSVRDFFANLLQ